MNESTPFPTDADIHAYIDGRLDQADRARMEVWLKRHPVRAEEIHSWRRDAQQLRTAFAGLSASQPAASLDPARIRGQRRRYARRRLMLAASLVLALGVGSLGGWQMRDMTLAAATPPMADALQAYRMLATNPHMNMDVTRQQPGELQAWINTHFQHATPLPDLQTEGFRPVGGRLLATDAGPAAVILYRNPQGRTISFYIRPPSPINGPLPYGQRRSGELATVYWSGNGYNYALVSRNDASDIQTMLKASALPASGTG